MHGIVCQHNVRWWAAAGPPAEDGLHDPAVRAVRSVHPQPACEVAILGAQQLEVVPRERGAQLARPLDQPCQLGGTRRRPGLGPNTSTDAMPATRSVGEPMTTSAAPSAASR